MKNKSNKVILTGLAATLSPIATSGCSCSIYPGLVGEPTDYSKDENWALKQTDGSKDVDVVFFLPTIAEPGIKDDIYPIDEYMRTNAEDGVKRAKACFADHANIYVPLTRQISEVKLFRDGIGQTYEKFMYSSVIRTDAYAALDYYFEHYNNNKPFILAGISHGGYIYKIALAEYMKIHPDYYERMIAAYLIGVNVNKQYLKDNTHVKAATGETDTHCVIAWNTEGPNPTMENQLLWDEPYCINPLNWRTDGTYAPISLNKGSYDLKTHSVIPGVADAQIDINRMSIVTTTAKEKSYTPIPKEWVAFGDQSYHFDDWNFYFMNIRENALKRIEAYFNNKNK